MGRSWAIGFLGSIVIVIGCGMFLVGCIYGIAGTTGGTPFAIALAVIALGSYMRYYSRNSVRLAEGAPAPPSQNLQVKQSPGTTERPSELRIFPEERRSLTDDAFKIFLVDHYGIKRHDVLGKFVCREQLFDTLEDAMRNAQTAYGIDVGNRMSTAKTCVVCGCSYTNGMTACPSCPSDKSTSAKTLPAPMPKNMRSLIIGGGVVALILFVFFLKPKNAENDLPTPELSNKIENNVSALYKTTVWMSLPIQFSDLQLHHTSPKHAQVCGIVWMESTLQLAPKRPFIVDLDVSSDGSFRLVSEEIAEEGWENTISFVKKHAQCASLPGLGIEADAVARAGAGHSFYKLLQ